MSRRSQRFRHQGSAHPAAILIALQARHQLAHRLATSALELTRLARGLGIEVVRTVQQARSEGALTALLNEDRLRELAALTGGPGPQRHGASSATPPAQRAAEAPAVDLVIVDGALTAAQQRTLELALGVEVLDRSAVILRVFEQRARSREARLQVELASRLYHASRIRDDGDLGSREGGGGRGGRGHSNVALRKQQNRERIAELKRELAALPARAAIRRQRRATLPQVALLGYTNAGKSSLMRALTGSGLVADELFSTVDTTVRALSPEGAHRILISDTVGFLADLPHALVASFRATLEEAKHADLLLLVADASDPDLHEQLCVTQQALIEIGAADVPQQLVLNKIDRLDAASRAALAHAFPDAWLVSAHDRHDVGALRARLQERFEHAWVEGSFLIPYDRARLLSEMHVRAHVLTQRHTDEGTHVDLRAAPSALRRWCRELGALAPAS